MAGEEELIIGMRRGGTPAEEEWQPPSDWLTVPEPEPYEAYFLIQTVNLYQYSIIYLTFADPKYLNTHFSEQYVRIEVDWGDGTSSIYGSEIQLTSDFSGEISHWYYNNPGQHLIKVTTVEAASCFLGAKGVCSASAESGVLIAKFGSSIKVGLDADSEEVETNYNLFIGNKYLRWVKVKGLFQNTRPSNGVFKNCTCLSRLELSNPLTYVNEYDFSGTYILKKLDLSHVTEIKNYGFSSAWAMSKINIPNCTRIGVNAFSSCTGMQEVYAPNCLEISTGAFLSCYNLKKATFAQDCTYGSNAFLGCFSLYPRPDGSTN